jgi:D-3-phosphoglycerate dehydrogenase / 2-oxoglutarate reductase
MSDRILVTCRQMQNCMDHFMPLFQERGLEVVMPEVVQQPSELELMETIGEYVGMIAGDDPLSSRVLANAKRMKAIVKWGIGTDGIDFAAAEALGISISNTPGVFDDEVADVAAGYLILLARQLHRIDRAVRAGEWLKHEGLSLAGKSLGIYGFGNTGSATAIRSKSLGMTVIACDPAPAAQATGRKLDVDLVGVEDLFVRSDFLVLCAPLTPETRHVVNESTLNLMRKGSYLVNVSRGPLVDESAVVEALRSGQIAAVAFDVFEEEPPPISSPLFQFDNCVFGSHNASNTREGVTRASEQAAHQLLTALGR